MVKQDEVWKTKDGREILVSEMSESHVRAALRMVIRNAKARKQKLLDEIENDYNEALHDAWGDR